MRGLLTVGRFPTDSPSYSLTPWQEQSRIPEIYLNSAITPSKQRQNTFAPNLTRLRDFKPRKLDKRPFTFKSHPALNASKNLAYLECIQYSWIDPKTTEDENAKEKKVIIARRRTRKGLEIKSIKKKIVDSSLLAQSHFPFFQEGTSSKNRLLITESKLNTTELISAATVDGSFFRKSNPKLSKKGLTTSHFSREFLTQIATIATISNQKRRSQKCRTQQASRRKDWMIQRDLFLQNNPKFKNWQRGTRKTITSSITLPTGLS